MVWRDVYVRLIITLYLMQMNLVASQNFYEPIEVVADSKKRRIRMLGTLINSQQDMQ